MKEYIAGNRRKTDMVYHLYVDESGKFSNLETVVNVVGGMLTSGDENKNLMAQEWNRKAQETGRKTPGVSPADLASFDFDHCTENKGPARWNIQKNMLGCYLENMKEIGARPVFFYAGHDFLDVDSTTTYISILTKGLIQLFNQLRSERPGDEIKLYAHIAIREHTTMTNITRVEQRETDADRRNLSQVDIKKRIREYIALLTSPTSRAIAAHDVEEHNIQIEQYRRAIGHAAYLCASEDVFRSRDFKDMMKNMEILENRFVKLTGDAKGAKTKRIENSWTVVCDCLCNSFYHCHTGRYAYEELFGNVNAIQIQADLSSAALEQEDIVESYRNAYASRFIRLMHLSFPKAETEEWMKRFNQAQPMHQRTFLNELVSYFDALTYYHVDDQEVLDTIRNTLAASEGIQDESVRNELQANLHVFHYAIHTHLAMAKDISADIRLFHEKIQHVKNKDAVAALMPVFLNRNIVLYTDRFEHQMAEDTFKKLEKYWKVTLEARQLLTGNEQEFDEEYGKELGSYLQLIRHMLRVETDGEMRDLMYMDAEERFHQALLNLPQAADQSRIYQSMSGIEQEMGHWDAALHLLFRASGTDEDGTNGMEMLWKKIGLPEYSEPFLFVMLLRLVDCMILAGEEKGKELLQQIQERLKEAFPFIGKTRYVEDPAFADGIRSIHPRTQVLWRLGSAIAAAGPDGWPQGKRLLESALEQLSASVPGTFRAIAVAVAAELAAWSLKYGDKKSGDAIAQFRQVYQKFANTHEDADMLNPFAALCEDLSSLSRFGDYIRITGVIAY